MTVRQASLANEAFRIRARLDDRDGLDAEPILSQLVVRTRFEELTDPGGRNPDHPDSPPFPNGRSSHLCSTDTPDEGPARPRTVTWSRP